MNKEILMYVLAGLVIIYLLSPLDAVPLSELDDSILATIYILYEVLKVRGKV